MAMDTNYALIPATATTADCFSNDVPVASPDSLESYIQTANRQPILTEEQEKSLIQQFIEFGDLEAAKKLVLSHLRLVISIARNYLGYGLPHADLIQEGNIGLMKAVKKFDLSHGVRLVTFAIHWIKAEINEYVIKNWRIVKLATTKAQRKLFFNLRKLKNAYNEDVKYLTNKQTSDIAKKLNVKESDVKEMEMRLFGNDIALEAPTNDNENHGYANDFNNEDKIFAPIDYLTDTSLEPSNYLEQQDDLHLQNEGLSLALNNLDERSKQIIQRRWLCENPATLHELAAEYSVSAERIRQIESKALQKMKKTLNSWM